MVKITHNISKEGIEVAFDKKPDQEILQWIRNRHFRWNRYQEHWWKRFTQDFWEETHRYFNQPLPGADPLMVDMTKPFTFDDEYIVVISGKEYPATSLQDASDRYLLAIQTLDIGDSETPAGLIYKDGKLIGHLAYNGRIFEGSPEDWTSDTKILYDPITEKPAGVKRVTMFYRIFTNSFQEYYNFLVELRPYVVDAKIFSAGIGEEYLILTGDYDKQAAMHPEESFADFDSIISDSKNIRMYKRLESRPAPEKRWKGKWVHINERMEHIEQVLKEEDKPEAASQEVEQEIKDERGPGSIRPEFMTDPQTYPMLKGREIEIIMPNGEKRKALFAIVELDNIIASHNEENFHSEPLYPKNAAGNNINDRNYKDDLSAQKAVMDYARELEPERLITTSRTPSGTPIITKDGFVVSGNNRAMSMKLAAKQHPGNFQDYVQFLGEEKDAFGFEGRMMLNIGSGLQYQIGEVKFSNPVLVRIDLEFPEYTTQELAKYNKDTKKSERPVDKAIKLSNILRDNVRCAEIIAETTGEYETFSEFYANVAGQKKLAKTLIECNLLTTQELPAYFSDTTFTETGKEFIENLLAALILDREALLATEQPGVKGTRQKLITSLPVLMKNAGLPEGSLKKNINDAVIFQQIMKASGSDFGDFVRQQNLFGTKYDRKTVYINRMIDAGKLKFKQAIEGYNEAIITNQGPSLFGGKPTLDEIFNHWIKGNVDETDQRLIEGSDVVSKEEKLLTAAQKEKSELTKGSFYLRFTEDPNTDLEHKYSRWYMDDMELEWAKENLKEGKDYYKDKDSDNYFKLHTGLSGHKLNAETLTDAIKEIEAKEWWFKNSKKDNWAIFESDDSISTQQDTPEGDTFYPYKIWFFKNQTKDFVLKENTPIKEVYGAFRAWKTENIDILEGGSDKSQFILYIEHNYPELKGSAETIYDSFTEAKDLPQKPEKLLNHNQFVQFFKSRNINPLLTPSDKLAEMIDKAYDRKDLPPASMVFQKGKRECIDKLIQFSIRSIGKLAHPWQMILESYATMKFLISAAAEFSMLSGALWIPVEDYRKEHLQAVQDAITNGEDVPAEVLADHPELKTSAVFKENTPIAEAKSATEKKDAIHREFVRFTDDTDPADRLKIYLVDGEEVRKEHIEFVSGGHGFVYNYIPKDEIWIDENQKSKPADMEATIKHEIFEVRKMRDEGLTYEEAHELANDMEKEQRQKDEPVKKLNPFIAIYKGKRHELYSDSKYHAQLEAAEFFKVPAKDSYKVDVYLAEEEKGDHPPVPPSKILDVFLPKIKIIKPFISRQQLNYLTKLYRSEEKQGAIDIATKLADIISVMPGQYQTESIKTPDKIVHLHYFHGGSDWYIIEKDKGSTDDEIEGVQYQAFGYVILNGDTQNAEWGYVDLKELIENNVELDFHWEPKPFSEIMAKQERVQKTGIGPEKPASLLLTDYANAFDQNKAIEALLDSKWKEKSSDWSADELQFITGYSGYGGLDEFGQISVGSLFEYFTPEQVIEKMWGLAYKYGYKDGPVLEPSCGTGLFFNRKYVSNLIEKSGYEINKYSAKIAKLLYPEANINDGEEIKYFEQLFIIKNYTVRAKVKPRYKLVIGNPPYGSAEGRYMGMGEKSYTHANNYIDYFILRGLDLLEKDGLLIYIIGAETAGGGVPFLDQGMNKVKEMINERGKLIDAYRLPSGIFARTEVTSDIVVFRKR